MIQKAGIKDEGEIEKMTLVYERMRNMSVTCFCSLLKRHPHFNYRNNILITILPKLSTRELSIRKEVTSTLFELLAHPDQSILDFKVEILRELKKVIKTKPHKYMEPNLLDCLVLHLIIVDEEKAKAI